MIVGDSYFITFNDNNRETLLKTFLRLYQAEEKTDKMEEVMSKYYRNYTLISCIIFGLIFTFIGLMVVAKVYNKDNE